MKKIPLSFIVLVTGLLLAGMSSAGGQQFKHTLTIHNYTNQKAALYVVINTLTPGGNAFNKKVLGPYGSTTIPSSYQNSITLTGYAGRGQNSNFDVHINTREHRFRLYGIYEGHCASGDQSLTYGFTCIETRGSVHYHANQSNGEIVISFGNKP